MRDLDILKVTELGDHYIAVRRKQWSHDDFLRPYTSNAIKKAKINGY